MARAPPKLGNARRAFSAVRRRAEHQHAPLSAYWAIVAFWGDSTPESYKDMAAGNRPHRSFENPSLLSDLPNYVDLWLPLARFDSAGDADNFPLDS